jgi:Tol biopolymer transport system component
MIRSIRLRALSATIAVALCVAPTSAQPTTRPASGPPPAPADAIDGTREAAFLSGVRQLTFGRDFERAGEAYFSPDMSAIIFQAVPRGERHYQMYLLNLMRQDDGTITPDGEPIRISASNSRNTCGWFSPDGRDILFASTAGKERAEEPTAGYQRQGRDYRWSYPPGMELWLLTPGERPAETDRRVQVSEEKRIALTDNDAYDAEGSFSPDGRDIVFTSNRDGDLELYAMRADGTGVTRLTHAPGYDGGPFCSPDGKRLVFRSDRKGNDLLQVFVADLVRNADGAITGLANERQLTDDANVNWGPFWHPSGEWIAWSTSRHGHHNYEVYLMRADGSDPTRITYAAGADVLPAFSPDGQYLIWAGKRTDDNTTQVFVARFRLPR